VDWLNVGLIIVALVVPAVVARRNLRRGTGDRRGALRLGVFFWVLSMVAWVLHADHTSMIGAELDTFMNNLGSGLLMGLWAGLVYLALEPYVRRLWPETMISWTRLLMGRFRDPRVGRDVLVGGLVGILIIVLQRLEWLTPTWFGEAPNIPIGIPDHAILGGPKAFAVIMNPMILAGALYFLLFLTIFRFLLRRPWPAVGATLVLFMAFDGHWFRVPGHGVTLFAAFVEVFLVYALLLFVLIRFGLLALVASMFFVGLLQHWPLTLDMSAWYGNTSLTLLLLLTAIAAIAMRTSMGGLSGAPAVPNRA
jgi:hypothetical protein